MPDKAHLERDIEEAARHVTRPTMIRITLTAGGTVIVVATPMDGKRLFRGVSAVTGQAQREPFLSGSVKHSSRAPWMVAVAKSGADEVLLVDEAGDFTEGTTSGILAVQDGVLWTHPFDGQILRSTTCEVILDIARSMGVKIQEHGPSSQGPWDGLYIASTTRGLAPVLTLDGVTLSGWDPVGVQLAKALGWEGP